MVDARHRGRALGRKGTDVTPMKHMPHTAAEKRIEMARELWGWIPHPTQREWLLDEHQVKVAACGRRWGKTESAAVDVATYALASAHSGGSAQMIVAPTYDQSKLIFATVERLFCGTSGLRAQVRITKTPYPVITFRGSRIMARTADEDGRNLRGHGADRVIVDEAAFVRDEVIEEVIGPMLADTNGRLVMISTPFGKNHFYRAFVEGTADGGWQMANEKTAACESAIDHQPSTISHSRRSVAAYRFPSWENPHISRDYIESQRAVMSDRQFRVEYEAEFIDDANSVFPWDGIEAAIEHPGSSIQDRVSSIRVAGVDWARYSDYTAVVVVEMANEEWRMADEGRNSIGHQPSAISHPAYRVLGVDKFNRLDWHSQVGRVADLLERYEVIAVAADQTSVGDPVLEILRDELWGIRGVDISVEGMVFTNQAKREIVDNLAIRLAHGDVSIPREAAGLINELRYYEYELTESGNVRTGAGRGHHDDCVTALALALSLAPRYGFPGGVRSSGRTRMAMRGW